jgi:hypothetical protein
MKKGEIAEACKDYYEHRDFVGNYAEFLMEDTHAVQERIKNICQFEYDFEKVYGTNLYLSEEQTEEVYEYILENIEEHTDTFNSYYVGSGSICSVSFGEQCEQLEGFRDENGDEIPVEDLIKQFEDADFVVNEGYAYYDLSSSGVHVDLLRGEKIPLLEKLAEEKLKKQN